jgi:Holliday junction resolvase
MRLSETEFSLICQRKPKGKPNGPKESHIQRDIKQTLEWHGWFVVKIHQSLGSYKGIADLYVIKDSRHVWIEVKTATGRLSEHQVRFRDDVQRHGGTYIIARCVDDVKFLCERGG